MWNSNSSSNTKMVAASSIIGAVIFSTLMDDPEKEESYSVHHEQVTSNLVDDHWVSISPLLLEPVNEFKVISISEIISMVKTTLGLPNKDVANIFGVTRQTLHSYANGADVNQKMNRSTHERVQLLNEIVTELTNKFSQSPGAMAKNYTIEGRTLLDLLKEEEIDVRKVLLFSDQLSNKMKSIPTSSSGGDDTLYNLTRSV
jgi:hypothetical protein